MKTIFMSLELISILGVICEHNFLLTRIKLFRRTTRINDLLKRFYSHIYEFLRLSLLFLCEHINDTATSIVFF